MAFHKSPLSADRMQKLLHFLRARGAAGATTREINRSCGSTRASSDVSELRANGLRVEMSYAGRSRNQRKIHRYVLIETKKS